MHKFMEQEMHWKTLSATLSGQSVMYLMQEPAPDKHIVVLEAKSNGTYDITLDTETRTLPNQEDIGKALGYNRPATKTEQGCILVRVLMEMVRRHRSPSEAAIANMMERFSRGHL